MYSLIIHGRRSIIELQKLLRNVSFFSSASDSDVSLQGQNLTVLYLVDSLGLSSKLAESISRKVSFEKKGIPDSVLNLLKYYGFTRSQISSIITDYPALLILDADKSLGPKLKFLQSRESSSTSEFTEILSTVPKILGKKEGKCISRYYDCVKQIIEADKSSKFEKLSLSSPQGYQENKIRNILVLRELGVSQKNLFSLLISDSNTVYGKEKFEESLKKIIELGFDPTTPTFVKAFNFVNQMSDKTIQEKLNVYKRLGFAEGDVWEIFKKWPVFLGFSEKKIENSAETFLSLGFSRDEFVMMVKRFPQCIGCSEETVKKKIEFLVKKMGWSPKAVFTNPQVLALSMEKKIVPRCNVIRALLSGKKGNSELPSVSSVLKISDQMFLNRYVKKHDDKQLMHQLMAIFTGDLCWSNSST